MRNHLMYGLGLISLPLLFSAACAPEVEPAPKDLDGVAHWFWNNFNAADDAAVGDAISKLHKAVDADNLEETKSGGLTRLTSDELAWLELEHLDPAGAVGIYTVNLIKCDIADLEEILYERDQKRFFPDDYQTYDRQYTSDFGAYSSREEPFLYWHVEIDATISGGPISVPYHESIDGGIRHVANIDAETTPHGTTLMTHTVMPEPATFEDDVNEWPMDFQISAIYERAPGEVIYLYGIWREMFFGGIGLGTEDAWVQNMQFDGLETWKGRIEEICATWPELP